MRYCYRSTREWSWWTWLMYTQANMRLFWWCTSKRMHTTSVMIRFRAQYSDDDVRASARKSHKQLTWVRPEQRRHFVRNVDWGGVTDDRNVAEITEVPHSRIWEIECRKRCQWELSHIVYYILYHTMCLLLIVGSRLMPEEYCQKFEEYHSVLQRISFDAGGVLPEVRRISQCFTKNKFRRMSRCITKNKLSVHC